MMARTLSPQFNLEGLRALVFSYDPEDDVAFLHIDEPRAAVTVEVDDAWYVRLADSEVVGMELHGLRRVFLSTPFFSRVFQPAIAELEAHAGAELFQGGGEEIVVRGTVEQLPKTTHLLILMIGQALAKYEGLQKAELAAAGRVFFADERREAATP
jgi:uncharacterized protein YuzE